MTGLCSQWQRPRCRQGYVLMMASGDNRASSSGTSSRTMDGGILLRAENIYDILSLHSPEGVIRFVSPAVFDRLGYEPAEVVGRPYEDFVHPDESAALRNALGEILAGRHAPVVRHRMRHKQGRYVWIETSGHGLRDEDTGRLREVVAVSRDVSAQMDAEENLRRAKEFAERLIETANVMIVGLDTEGLVEVFNRAAEKLTGYSKSEVLGKSWFDFLVPGDRYPDVVGVFRGWQAGNYSQNQVYENPIITKSGEERYISWQNSRIERDGRFAGTLSFGMDITERKRTERRLLLSDQILKNVAAVVLMADATGRVTYASPSALAIFGYTPDELMGDGWWNLMYPDPTERERERQFVLHSVESKFPLSSEPYERLLRHKHGEPRWIAWQDAVGPDGSIIGVGHDITRRKTAEEQLQKVMHAVEQSPSSVVITDAEGRIEYVNPKFTEITGYSNEEVLGQNPRILKSGEMTQEQYRALWETITGGEEWRGEFHNRRKDGELFWEMASISPVKDSRGEITHFVAIKEDITHRKNLELQLRQSQKMEAVGTLAGGIAHDFNNLLTAINGYSELVWDKLPDSDPLREIVAEIRKAGDRAASLTRQLLAFSRKQVMRPILFNINDVVRELEHLLRRVLGENIE
ncbi:MAG: PAS domain S-box protein, partial [Acidobacteria bacterium]|nr:PAS domain S-box protein [Acidobacteriota bacterium]